MERRTPVEDRLVLFGQTIRQHRHALGWSQEQLAEAAGLDQTYVSGVETGRRNPTLKVVFRLSDALGQHPSTLFSSDR